MTTLDTIFTDAVHGSSCGISQPSSFNPSLYTLASTSVEVSTECVTHRLMLLPVIRALGAGRSLQGGPAPFTPSLTVKGASPVAVSTEFGNRPWQVIRGLRAGNDTSVEEQRPIPFMARKGGTPMPRRTPESTLAVDAISDARRYLMAMFMGNDDRLDAIEEGALLLIDTAAYRATRTDLNRRVGENYTSHGDVSPRLLREIDEIDRDYAHVIELHAA